MTIQEAGSFLLSRVFNHLLEQLVGKRKEQRMPIHDALHIIVAAQQDIRDSK